MKILVTGAAGFVGFHLARRLLERGEEVVGLDNLNDYYEVGLKEARLHLLEAYPGFRFVRASLEDSMPDLREHYRTSASAVCFSSTARNEVKVGGRKLIGSAQRRY